MNALNDQAVFKTPPWFYFVLAFIIAWTFWLVPLLGSRNVIAVSASVQTIFLVLGAFGPFFAAFISRYRDGGWPAVRSFASRAFRFRIGPRYLMAALFLVPLLGLVAAWIYAQQGGPALALAVPPMQILILFPLLFFVGGSLNEEFGWAYAIDRLQQRYRLLPAAVILGVIWGFWHLPLFFIVGATQSFMPFWAFVMFTVGARVLFVWAYEGTAKSILTTLLFHTTTNLTLNLFVLVDSSSLRNEHGFIAFACLMLGTAVVVAFASRRYRGALQPAADHPV
ncbi:MAG: CPBP family glutamic-type intramembrane protease [Rhodanobacter sp.]